MNSKGFTLIELLVVISIIGIISAGLITIIDPVQKMRQARDSQRLVIMASVRRSLQNYLVSFGNFPSANSGGASSCTSSCGGWEVAGCDIPFLKAMQDTGDLKTDIKDPTMNGTPSQCYNIKYYRYPPGSYGCDVSKGYFYVIGVTDMESTASPYPSSPGWGCSGRNWQGEFDYVEGGFQY